jgi:hypothetical protein
MTASMEETLHVREEEEPGPDHGIEIQLEDLNVSPSRLSSRLGINSSHVRMLSEAAETWPPILVMRSTREIVDGLHRYRAAKLLGRKSIRCIFFVGSAQDAFGESLRCNVRPSAGTISETPASSSATVWPAVKTCAAAVCAPARGTAGLWRPVGGAPWDSPSEWRVRVHCLPQMRKPLVLVAPAKVQIGHRYSMPPSGASSHPARTQTRSSTSGRSVTTAASACVPEPSVASFLAAIEVGIHANLRRVGGLDSVG